MGGGVTGSDSFGLLVDGLSLVRSGLRSLQVADRVRAGMEVMSERRDDSEPAASAPAGTAAPIEEMDRRRRPSVRSSS
jgi:hypothetical protein